MSDPNNPYIEKRDTPQWSLYQRENFWKVNEGEVPLFNTEPGKLEELAKEKLTQGGWLYASSNAGQSYTHLANRQAFYRHRIIPRQLIDTKPAPPAPQSSAVRTSFSQYSPHPIPHHSTPHLILALTPSPNTTDKVAAPIGFAPIGINKIYHPLGELPVATVAAELNLPYCLSTAGSTSIEAVAAANGPGPRFYQLYLPHDDELTISLLTRAFTSGFDVCVLTTDTWQLGWRHDDVASGNYAFYRGIGADLGLSDPVFTQRLRERGIDPGKSRKGRARCGSTASGTAAPGPGPNSPG
ncbi:hypothetical protein MMC30_001531 [Trapelia coarctata]|nr:hypothetical protein [Trapelia coarctata]